jgi:NAD(P)-dependent dehydrogenase (short-subunit alcohol dehydrogenase family)
VDTLFVNAGRDVAATAVVDTTPEQFDRVSDLNFRGAFFTTRALVPLMRDGGTIVLTASIAGSNGGPGHAVYNATKAAVRSLARTLTAELRERRIRANAVSPGPTGTAGFSDFFAGDAEVIAQVAAQIPVGRIADPSEIAAAVLFLACDESSFVAGAELVVDGGMRPGLGGSCCSAPPISFSNRAPRRRREAHPRGRPTRRRRHHRPPRRGPVPRGTKG